MMNILWLYFITYTAQALAEPMLTQHSDRMAAPPTKNMVMYNNYPMRMHKGKVIVVVVGTKIANSGKGRPWIM